VAYTRQYGPLQNWLWPYSTWDYPAAALNMSALDLAKFFTALTTGKLLRQATIESMWAQVQLESGKKINYAQGWTVGEIAGRKTVGHEGGGCAWVSHVPSASLTVIVLTNLAGSGADLGDKIAAQLLQG
jgi:CubicO group peptidase (beta-lactamase class C family)